MTLCINIIVVNIISGKTVSIFGRVNEWGRMKELTITVEYVNYLLDK